MEKASRTRLVALAVLLAVAAPLVILALAGGDDDDGAAERRPAGLRVERTPGGLPEITIYLEDRSLNKASTARGAATVVVECVDADGQVVSSRPEAWPFLDTDEGTVRAARAPRHGPGAARADRALPPYGHRPAARGAAALTDLGVRSHSLVYENRLGTIQLSSLKTMGGDG